MSQPKLSQVGLRSGSGTAPLQILSIANLVENSLQTKPSVEIPAIYRLGEGPVVTPDVLGNGTARSEAKKFFIEFLESYLCISFQGFQSGFGRRPDLILFRGKYGSTLAVPTAVMLESREVAHEIIRLKIAANEMNFMERQ